MPPTIGERASWFRQDRFGLFLHWGVASLPSSKISGDFSWVRYDEGISDVEYEKYFRHFDPDLYDPSQWAAEAKRAGMRYVVVTAKHHDGFCLWDSQLTEFKAPNTPAGRDLLRPLVEAVRAEGLKIGFYYSLLDWNHPAFPLDAFHPMRNDPTTRSRASEREMSVYDEYIRGQVRELLTLFGPIDILWFDFSYPSWEGLEAKGFPVGEWRHAAKGRREWESDTLLETIRELQPHVLVNDRLDLAGDFLTPEGYIPPQGASVAWESCLTLNESWGYNANDLFWKPVEALVQALVDAVSKGGNLLLGVGPTGRGEFEPQARERLRGIGDWMRRHARSIYGCSRSDFVAPSGCRYTQSDRRLYLHLFTWPIRELHLEGLGSRVEYAQLLHDGMEIRTHSADPSAEVHQMPLRGDRADELVVHMPSQRPEVPVPVIELFLREQ